MGSLRAKAEEKAVSLVKDKNTLNQQLMFATYGLLLVDYWRLSVPHHALVPYIGKKLNIIDGFGSTTVGQNSQIRMKFDQNVTDVHTKESESQNMMEFESCEKNVSECMCVRVSCDVSVQTCLSDSAECDSPPRENIKQKQDQATMTPKCESLSEREQFYLEQIENLQKEKMNLRKVCTLLTIPVTIIYTILEILKKYKFVFLHTTLFCVSVICLSVTIMSCQGS